MQGPDNAWEFYTVLADAPVLSTDDTCCDDAATPVVLGAPAEQSCCG